MTGAARAGAISLALHTVGVAAALVLWRAMPADARRGDLGTLDVVALEPAAPGPLPPVASLPLPSAAEDSTFAPIEHREPVHASPHHPFTSSPLHRNVPPPQPLPTAAATEFFGVAAQGQSVVYVVDRSASMGLENRLGRAVAEVKASLTLLPADHRFQVLTYARTPLNLAPSTGMVAADSDAIATSVGQLNQLRAEGGTDHVRALKAALLLKPDVLFFLTDEDELTLADVKAITAYNHGRTCIHAICLVTPSSANTPMRELAKQNGGQFRVAGR